MRFIEKTIERLIDIAINELTERIKQRTIGELVKIFSGREIDDIASSIKSRTLKQIADKNNRAEEWINSLGDLNIDELIERYGNGKVANILNEILCITVEDASEIIHGQGAEEIAHHFKNKNINDVLNDLENS